MWELAAPWWVYVVRAAVVFGFLLLLLRLAGKRQIGQMTPFDLVLLLVISNAVQNSMNGGDNSITAGLTWPPRWWQSIRDWVGWLSAARRSTACWKANR